ncbi:MAG: hypothetical protein IJY16_05420 [Clostridia bacterium]|nr:hypothetical protein [Clostridia bacterium]
MIIALQAVSVNRFGGFFTLPCTFYAQKRTNLYKFGSGFGKRKILTGKIVALPLKNAVKIANHKFRIAVHNITRSAKADDDFRGDVKRLPTGADFAL